MSLSCWRGVKRVFSELANVSFFGSNMALALTEHAQAAIYLIAIIAWASVWLRVAERWRRHSCRYVIEREPGESRLGGRRLGQVECARTALRG
ncbi:hypothetical protein [Polaromonas sp. CG9_12]|nr:hypothetical protein [Polaromonas sp. CG9_12]